MTFRGPTGINGFWRKVKNLWGEPDVDSFLSVVYKKSGIGGVEQVTISLEGDGPIYRVDFRALRLGKHFGEIEIVGDDLLLLRRLCKLKIVTLSKNWEPWIYVITPNLGGVIAYHVALVKNRADLVYRRLILTCAVWGLADCPHEEIPHWRQLKIFRGDR